MFFILGSDFLDMQAASTLFPEPQDAESSGNNDESNVDDPVDSAYVVEDPGDPSYVVEEDNFGLSKKSRSKNQVCHVCNATFARVNHLTRHMILHRNVLVHKCARCDKVCKTNMRGAFVKFVQK